MLRKYINKVFDFNYILATVNRLKQISLFLTFLVVFSSFNLFNLAIRDYPIPSDIDNMLFYVQRTVNSNTIVYELNLDKDSNLVENMPIKAYWIKYEDANKKEGLSYIQRKLAYGIESRLINKEKQIFGFHFVSYKKRELYLFKSKDEKKFKVYTYTNNRLAELQKVFVQIEGGSFMFPNVKFVLLTTKLYTTGEQLIEKIKP